jgi:hypothetical protein
LRLDALADNPGRWLMLRLNFSPALSDARWTPGTDVEIGGGLPSGSGSPLQITAIGCSGPMRDHWTFVFFLTTASSR